MYSVGNFVVIVNAATGYAVDGGDATVGCVVVFIVVCVYEYITGVVVVDIRYTVVAVCDYYVGVVGGVLLCW